MYFAIDKLNVEKYCKFDFTLNFGISTEVRASFITLLNEGGDYDNCVKTF